MPFEMERSEYARLYGPTAGDSLRLGDTSLFARIEHDYATYGDEVLWGFGKNLRDGMMATAHAPRDSVLDLVILNVVVIDPVLGVVKGNIGVKDGLIVGVGKAGNPDISDNVDLLIGNNTSQIQGEGLIATPGGVDVHVHLFSPRLMANALAVGITSIVSAGTRDNPGFNIQRMLEAFEDVPINVGVQGRGSSNVPGPMRESLETGACGLKIHEDYAAYPEVIDAALSVADQMGVAVALHTDTLNESCQVDETLAAIGGRAVHAYHVEGTGGGHHPDTLVLAGPENVISSSTNPTLPYTINTVAEHPEMIMTCHALNAALEDDVEAARSRVRAPTIAAESVLQDRGAISITSSDAQGMGRIGETIRRTWQLAHVMKEQFGANGGDDNQRILRYIAKYTINPAITHGISRFVGSLEPGKVADIVLWRPAFFGAKPESVLKGGFLAWGAIGDGNASLRGAQPVYYGPYFGGIGNAQRSLSWTFVSPAAHEAGIGRILGTRRHVVPVSNTRRIGKRHMLRGNSWTPEITVDAQSFEVRANGEVMSCEPVVCVPLNQRYFLA